MLMHCALNVNVCNALMSCFSASNSPCVPSNVPFSADVDSPAMSSPREHELENVRRRVDEAAARAFCSADAAVHRPQLARRGETRTRWCAHTHPRNAQHLRSALQQWLDFAAKPKHERPRHARSRSAFIAHFNRNHPGDPALPNIPRSTFNDHLNQTDPFACVHPGRPPLLDYETQLAVADAVCRYDDENQGRTRKWVKSAVLQDGLGLSASQSANFFKHTLRHVKRDGKEVLSIVSPDAVSHKQTAAITEEAQRRFFRVVAEARKLCADGSSGLDRDGKSYRDLEKHFVFNLDEEVCVASADGKMKIVGRADKKHHFRNTHASRQSISMTRCGSAAGEKGPTIYNLTGVKRNAQCSDEWLRKVGNPPGSALSGV